LAWPLAELAGQGLCRLGSGRRGGCYEAEGQGQGQGACEARRSGGGRAAEEPGAAEVLYVFNVITR